MFAVGSIAVNLTPMGRVRRCCHNDDDVSWSGVVVWNYQYRKNKLLLILLSIWIEAACRSNKTEVMSNNFSLLPPGCGEAFHSLTQVSRRVLMVFEKRMCSQ